MTSSINQEALRQFQAALTIEGMHRSELADPAVYAVIQGATSEQFGEHYAEVAGQVLTGYTSSELHAAAASDRASRALLAEILEQIGD